MSDLKAPTTFKEQVNRLSNHGMLVEDKSSAIDFLSKNNYYRFTGYGIQFRVFPDKSEYQDGTTFETVSQIYNFDEELRILLLKYISKAEVFYRTIISYGFSHLKCRKPLHDQQIGRAHV